MNGTGASRRILVMAGCTTFLAGAGMNVQVRMNAELVIGGAQPIGVALANMAIQLISVVIVVPPPTPIDSPPIRRRLRPRRSLP